MVEERRGMVKYLGMLELRKEVERSDKASNTDEEGGRGKGEEGHVSHQPSCVPVRGCVSTSSPFPRLPGATTSAFAFIRLGSFEGFSVALWEN